MSTPEEVAFILQSITTEQFAIINERIPENENLELLTEISFGASSDGPIISVFPKFTFSLKEVPVMLIETGCHFKIKEQHWPLMIQENGNVLVPAPVMRHMTIIAIGTTRGVLHAKTEGRSLNEYILPTINVAELIQGDVEVGR